MPPAPIGKIGFPVTIQLRRYQKDPAPRAAAQRALAVPGEGAGRAPSRVGKSAATTAIPGIARRKVGLTPTPRKIGIRTSDPGAPATTSASVATRSATTAPSFRQEVA